MRKVLTAEFFNRDTCLVAQELLGKFLVRRVDGQEMFAMITETEAYDGPQDLASHASKGKTNRTQIMFGQPGYFYVYLCYGMHYMVNIVTREENWPAAVLIRGVQLQEKHFDGPGKVSKFFGVDKSMNGKSAGKQAGFWFEDRGVAIPKSSIKKLERVGVAYAGPVWSAKKFRFLLADAPKNSAKIKYR